MPPLAALADPLEVFAPAFAQRALICVLLLALVAAAIGWAVILRDLPFFTHAVGAGAYPVLLLCLLAGTGVAAGALVGAVAFAIVLALLVRSRSAGEDDALIGLLLAGALAAGAVIAGVADDARLTIPPEGLLFGSILAVDDAALAVIAVAAVLAGVAAALLSGRWLAAGFDPGIARRTGAVRDDVVLLIVVAVCVAAALPVAGSLLAGALLIVPAATVRLTTDRAGRIPPWTLLLAALEGTLGLYLALALDLPSGAAIAGLSGLVFFFVVLVRRFDAAAGRRMAPSALLLFGLLLFAGCGSGATSRSGDSQRLQIAASTPQIADIVRHVAGEVADVTTLMPLGVDPHEFEPRAGKIIALTEAAVIFRGGGELDAWIVPAAKTAGAAQPPVDLSRAVVSLAAPGTGGINSHWFLAPENVARAAQRVRDELIKADPPSRETYRANTDQYLEQIAATQQSLERCVAKVPPGRRALVSNHDEFDYLADAFGLKIVARLNTEGGERSPSARQLQESLDDARRGDARAIVTDRGGATRLEQQVAAKLGIPVLALYSDNLTTGDDASTLLEAIGYDISRIVAAVSGGAVHCPPVR